MSGQARQPRMPRVGPCQVLSATLTLSQTWGQIMPILYWVPWLPKICRGSPECIHLVTRSTNLKLPISIFFYSSPHHIDPHRQLAPPSPPLSCRHLLWTAPKYIPMYKFQPYRNESQRSISTKFVCTYIQ